MWGPRSFARFCKSISSVSAAKTRRDALTTSNVTCGPNNLGQFSDYFCPVNSSVFFPPF